MRQKKIYILSVLLTTQKLALLYKESPHKTVKWETENTVLCEIVLCETILVLLPKTVLCETLLCTMRGIEIFQNQSYREISPM